MTDAFSRGLRGPVAASAPIGFEAAARVDMVNDPRINPSNLDARHLNYFGPGVRVTPGMAWDQFRGSRNPFVPGTAEHDAYTQYVEERLEEERTRYMKLPEFPAVIRPTKRRLSMPRFKIPFDTEHDARLRLAGSFIFVGTNMVYVRDIRKLGDDYLLIIEADRKQYRVWYSSDAVDLRSPEPQYIVYENRPGFIGRHPNRQQRQGLSSDNAFIKYVGHAEFTRLHAFDWLQHKMDASETLWSPTLADLMMRAEAFSSLRLSKNVAVYRDENKAMAEYRGRTLGELNDNSVKIEECDNKSWIERDMRQVGCSLRV